MTAALLVGGGGGDEEGRRGVAAEVAVVDNGDGNDNGGVHVHCGRGGLEVRDWRCAWRAPRIRGRHFAINVSAAGWLPIDGCCPGVGVPNHGLGLTAV